MVSMGICKWQRPKIVDLGIFGRDQDIGLKPQMGPGHVSVSVVRQLEGWRKVGVWGNVDA